MKTFKTIFAVALAAIAVGSTSCSKEDAGNQNGETKSFFLQLGKGQPGSRAEGADQSGETVTIADGYVIFATGDVIGKVVTVGAGGDITTTQAEAGVEIGEIPASTNACYFYGNLGSTLTGIESQTSIEDIEAMTWVLADIQNAANDVTNVPVYGSGTVSPGSGQNAERLEAKFNVYPIASRLQIGQITCSDTDVTELTIDGIYINGYYHSMDAGATFDADYLIDNSINVTRYPSAGYAAPYNKMSDVFSGVNLKSAAATPSNGVWAYNFFPAAMPHIVIHVASISAEGKDATNKWITVSKYSTDGSGTANFTTAVKGEVYTLNIDIDDYKKQIGELPEPNSNVMGYVDIDVINWKGVALHPEW